MKNINNLNNFGFNVKFTSSKEINNILFETLKIFPTHKNHLVKSINCHEDNEFKNFTLLAKLINNIISNDLKDFLNSYKWFCTKIMKEQILFMKNKKYSSNSFREVYENLYSKDRDMSKYLKGLLMSQILWSNHAKSIMSYMDFINSYNKKFNFLEIGAGHGLYTFIACKNNLSQKISVWDVSKESLKQVKIFSENLKVKKVINILNRNILKSPPDYDYEKYDLIVMIEILECLENPNLALSNVKKLLSRDGILYLNFPINSPAPDNVFLISNIEELEKLLLKNGFFVDSINCFPAGGISLQKAIEQKLTISCIVKASKNKI